MHSSISEQEIENGNEEKRSNIIVPSGTDLDIVTAYDFSAVKLRVDLLIAGS